MENMTGTDVWNTTMATDVWNATTTMTSPLPAPRPTRLLPSMFLAFRVADKLYISKIVLFCIGSVGNLLSLAVLCRRGMRSSTSSVYLQGLAVSDFMIVWSYLMVVIGQYYEPYLNTLWFCKLFLWFETSFQQVSSYLVICMTAERFFAVAFPLKVGRIFTKKVAYALTAAIFVTFLVLQTPYLLMIIHYHHVVCTVDLRNHHALYVRWSKVDASVGAYIPAILILLLNILIIATIKRARANQQKLQSGTDTKSSDQSAQITRMLLTVSITYWVLNMPMAVFTFGYEYFFDFGDVQEFGLAYLTQELCVFLMIANSSINIFLYCLAGKRFRQEFLALVLCKKRGKQGQGWSGATRSTDVTASTNTISMSQVNMTTET